MANKVYLAGEKIVQEDYDLFAKQKALEKMLHTLSDWFNDSNASTLDLHRHLKFGLEKLDKTCEYCLENQLVYNQIQTEKSVGWYEEPPKRWTNDVCENCERTVPRTHLM